MKIINSKGKWYLLKETGDEIHLAPLDEDKAYPVTGKIEKKRTVLQNRSLHKLWSLVATELNNAGLDIKEVIKADVSWSMLTVKELMWKRLQKVLIGKESTTNLTTTEVDTVYDVFNRLLGEKFSIHVPYPCNEELLFKQNYGGI